MSTATVLMGLITLTVHSLVMTGHDHTNFVGSESKLIHGLRNSGDRIAKDLRRASPSKVTVTTLGDGNHQVQLQMPLSFSNGAVEWGVRDAALGTTEETRTRPGWAVRYTIVTVQLDGGRVDRQLRRQILDDQGKLVRQGTVMRGIAKGQGAKPGFRVTLNGSMYQVSLFAHPDPLRATDNPRNLSFDVAVRNQ